LRRALPRALALALCGVAVLACASAPKQSARKRTVLMTSVYDDARVGRENAEQVKSDMGLLDDPALAAYVDAIGHKLLRGVARGGFDYQFHVVDMTEPNAFALPGGYIYVSRGLLAMANSEDELACVIGHEITHAFRRHSAAQQAIAQRQLPLAMPWQRAAQMASYSREMEREADEGGQILCAAAGYDPMAMSTFLTSLERYTRVQGNVGGPSFFDSHPGSAERAAADAVRAREIRWQRDPARAEGRSALLAKLDGLPVGQRPETGMFVGDRFVHPELGFSMRFPPGWRQANTASAVGATQPQGEAVVFLSADAPPGEISEVAEAWVEKQRERGGRLDVQSSSPVKVGGLDAWRLDASAATGGGRVEALLTFIPFRQATWVITGASPARFARKYQGTLLSTARSFRPLAAGDLSGLSVNRLRVTTARAGESFTQLGARTGNAWSPPETAVYNGVLPDHRFAGGETVKIAKPEPYAAGSGAK
jgi:predicted Zn-dependent protease